MDSIEQHSVFQTVIIYAPICAVFMVQLSGIAPIYQIIAHKHTGNVSPIPFHAMVFNCILWTCYGLINVDSTVLFANAAGVLFGTAYLIIFCIYSTSAVRKRNVIVFVVLILISMFCIQFPIWIDASRYRVQYIGFIGSFTAFLLMSSPLTEMRRVIREKSTQRMSKWMSLAMTFNGLSWTIYGAIIDDYNPFICIPNGFGFIAGCIQLMLFWTYPKKSSQSYNKLVDRKDNEDSVPSEGQSLLSELAPDSSPNVDLRQRVVLP